MLPPPPRSTLFPYTTLFRSRDRPSMVAVLLLPADVEQGVRAEEPGRDQASAPGHSQGGRPLRGRPRACCAGAGDRKSTRLNSSHLGISYAVFCLKKKKNAPT